MNRHLSWFSFHWKWKRMPAILSKLVAFVSDLRGRENKEFAAGMHFPCSQSIFPCSWCENQSNAIATMRDVRSDVWVACPVKLCSHNSITKIYVDEFDVRDFLLLQSNAEKSQFCSSVSDNLCVQIRVIWNHSEQWHTNIHTHTCTWFRIGSMQEHFQRFPFLAQFFTFIVNRFTVSVWWCSCILCLWIFI